MPNYNHARYVGQAIEAVVSQSRPPDEYLVVDDNSSDDSAAVIAGYARAVAYLRFERNPRNLGAVANMRRLVEAARGDYVYGGSADDFVLPGFFATAMSLAERYPSAGIVFGNIVGVDAEGRAVKHYRGPAVDEPVLLTARQYLDYLESKPAYHSLCGATIYRRDALLEAGNFRPELGHWCDTFAARAIALEHGALYVPQTFMAWRKLPGSLSHGSLASWRSKLEIVERAAALMRSGGLADRFPADHVSRWRRQYRRSIWLRLARDAGYWLAGRR